MSLAITQEHRELGRVVRDFAGKNELVRQARAALGKAPAGTPAAEPDSWLGAMADVGWTGLHLPAEVGGSGFGLAELAVVLDELGAAVAPGPFLPAVIGSAIINAVGGEALRQELLPGAAAGTIVIAYGVADGLTVTAGTPGGGEASGVGPVAQPGAATATGLVPRVAGGAWASHAVLVHGADLLVVTAAGPADGSPVARKPLKDSIPGWGWRRWSCRPPR
jgi:hypothetical protein